MNVNTFIPDSSIIDAAIIVLFDNFAMKFLSFYINYFWGIFVFANLKCIFTTEVCISSSFNQKNV